MKYFICKDFWTIKNKLLKIILSYLFLITITFILDFVTYKVLDIDIIKGILGLLDIKTSGLIYMLLRIFQITLYLYITFRLVIDDIMYSASNIFLRISKVEWVIKKIISVLIFCLTIKTFVYLYLVFLSLIFTNNSFNLLNLFCNDIIITISIQLFLFILIIIKNKKIFYVFLLLFILLLYFIIFLNYNVSFIIILILIILNILLSKKMSF